MIRSAFRLISPQLAPCLRNYFKVAMPRSSSAVLLGLCRRHFVLLQRLNVRVQWCQTLSVQGSEEAQFERFQELLSQSRFDEIVELWEREGDAVRNDPALYPLVVMALERTGQSESGKSTVQVVPVRSVALVFETAKQLSDYNTAVKIFNLFWKSSCSLKPEELSFSETFTEDSDWLLRAINAAIFLQAICIRDLNASRAVEARPDVKPFLRHRFFDQLKYSSLTPNADTYEAILLQCCFRSEAIPWARSACHLVENSAHPLKPRSFTAWTHHCGTLVPLQAHRGIMHTVWEHIQYRGKVALQLEQYRELLSVRYRGERSGVNHREAVSCIFKIAGLMKNQGVLVTTEACNLVLSAFARMGAVGPMYATLKANSITPDLTTYHILVDGCLVDGGVRPAKGAIYTTWRMFIMNAHRVQPDIDLINKLIRCCELCRDYDRAFFFLSVLNDFSLQPNLQTFSLLFKICRAAKDQERFRVMTSLAHSCLPNETASINSLVAGIKQDWEMEEDVSLATKLISQTEPAISG